MIIKDTAVSKPVQTFSAKEIKALIEEGRKLGDQLRKDLEPMFNIPPEVMSMVLR